MANISISLTPVQAKVLFNVCDGASDAGACEGGNTEQESDALSEIMHKLIAKHDVWKSVSLQKD